MQTIRISSLLVSLITGLSLVAQPYAGNNSGVQKVVGEIFEAKIHKDFNTEKKLWEHILITYPSEYISLSPKGTGSYTAHFNLAQLYISNYGNLDSALSHVQHILMDLPNESIGGYEANIPGDVYASVSWAKMLNGLELSDSLHVLYLKRLRRFTSSPISSAAINIEILPLLYSMEQYGKADSIILNIVKEQELKWKWFKSSGDLRWSAIRALSMINSTKTDLNHSEQLLEQIMELNLSGSVGYAAVYSLAEACLENNKVEKAYNYLTLLKNMDASFIRAEFPFSFNESGTLIEEYQINLQIQKYFTEHGI